MEELKITNVADFNKMLEKSPVTVVDFSARWCGPCKALAPQLVELSKEPQLKKVHFVKIDVDDNQEISELMNIQAMPTVFIFRETKQIEHIVGANFEKIRDAIFDAVKQAA